VSRAHVLGALADEIRAALESFEHAAMIEALDEVEDLLGADAPLLGDPYATEFAVKDKDMSVVVKRHVVFHHDAFVLESAARVGEEQLRCAESTEAVSPNARDCFDFAT